MPKPTAASEKVLLAMSRSRSFSDRRETFVHEYSHALFFLNSEFRNDVRRIWFSLKPEERRFLKGALMASGYYESGEEQLLQNETLAHAIAPIFSPHGFGNVLLSAKENCENIRRSSKACEDFWSYNGRVLGLLEKLHDQSMEVSQCRIPLLIVGTDETSKVCELRGENIQGVRELKPIQMSAETQKVLKMFRGLSSDDDYEAGLKALQKTLDSRHKKK